LLGNPGYLYGAVEDDANCVDHLLTNIEELKPPVSGLFLIRLWLKKDASVLTYKINVTHWFIIGIDPWWSFKHRHRLAQIRRDCLLEKPCQSLVDSHDVERDRQEEDE